MELGTSQRRVRCVCPKGHVFIALLHDSIEVCEDSALLEGLADGGMQLVRCPHCGTVWPLAEPVLMHDSARERVALFLPDVLAHLELEIRTDVLKRLVASDLEKIPLYASDFATLVGVDSLQRWLEDGDSKVVRETAGPRGAVSMIPRIHSAFADLDEPERVSVSSIPPEPEPGPEPEQVAEEDWLDDSEIAAARKSLVESRPAKEATPDPGANAGIDYVGLMSDADDDPDADADEAPEEEGEGESEAESGKRDILAGFDDD